MSLYSTVANKLIPLVMKKMEHIRQYLNIVTHETEPWSLGGGGSYRR
jgi:hypothetical protein